MSIAIARRTIWSLVWHKCVSFNMDTGISPLYIYKKQFSTTHKTPVIAQIKKYKDILSHIHNALQRKTMKGWQYFESILWQIAWKSSLNMSKLLCFDLSHCYFSRKRLNQTPYKNNFWKLNKNRRSLTINARPGAKITQNLEIWAAWSLLGEITLTL